MEALPNRLIIIRSAYKGLGVDMEDAISANIQLLLWQLCHELGLTHTYIYAKKSLMIPIILRSLPSLMFNCGTIMVHTWSCDCPSSRW
ncbi:hypothetical protein CR513_07262, partial [Mucuna pruriens]